MKFMNNNEIIELGVKLGLLFNEKTNFSDSLNEGRIVFDGCNGQRFLIDNSWSDEKIYNELGKSLILMGQRLKCLELQKVISINSD